jgi:hypothetical protein
MASIVCKLGDTAHSHTSAAEVADCSIAWGKVTLPVAEDADSPALRSAAASFRAADEAQAADEALAESRVERWFEERGYWDARAQEDYEASYLGW